MTRLVRIHLGTASGRHKHAFDGCSSFMRQLRSVLATPDGASFVTVSDHGTMWVEAAFMSGFPGAECWAKKAEALAPEIWATLGARRVDKAR